MSEIDYEKILFFLREKVRKVFGDSIDKDIFSGALFSSQLELEEKSEISYKETVNKLLLINYLQLLKENIALLESKNFNERILKPINNLLKNSEIENFLLIPSERIPSESSEILLPNDLKFLKNIGNFIENIDRIIHLLSK